MAQSRKDSKGRALRKGECFNEKKGLYVYSYSDPFGKRNYIYSKSLIDLRAKEDQIFRDRMDGVNGHEAGRVSLNSLFERYISTKTNLRKTTYGNYLYYYRHFVKKTFGSRFIDDIHYSDILSFYTRLLNERHMKFTTVKNIQTFLHPTFQLAVRDELIRVNPTDYVITEVKKSIKDLPEKRHALTPEQQKIFMSELMKQRNIRWYPIFTVFLGTGCRAGEIAGLRWDDVDMKNRVIHIRQIIDDYHHHPRESTERGFMVAPPKTHAGTRDIPMIDQVYEAFQTEKEFQEISGTHCTRKISGIGGFVFCGIGGNIINFTVLNRVIIRICDEYNIEEIQNATKEKRDPVLLPHFTCHVLRHTFCSRLCENDGNIKAIQEIMGHQDIKTTMDIYAEISDKRKQETMDSLSKNSGLFGKS